MDMVDFPIALYSVPEGYEKDEGEYTEFNRRQKVILDFDRTSGRFWDGE